MYNSDYTAPRISFSSDFVDRNSASTHNERSRPLPPPSSDFEFSVTGYSMLTADELFCKGRLLPYRDGGGHRKGKNSSIISGFLSTGDGGGEDSREAMRQQNKGGGGSSSGRWKGLLGFKRRSEKCEGGGRRCSHLTNIDVGEEEDSTAAHI